MKKHNTSNALWDFLYFEKSQISKKDPKQTELQDIVEKCFWVSPITYIEYNCWTKDKKNGLYVERR